MRLWEGELKTKSASFKCASCEDWLSVGKYYYELEDGGRFVSARYCIGCMLSYEKRGRLQRQTQ